MRRSHAQSRQSALGEQHTQKADIVRTGSLQQPASEARRWNVNAGPHNEHLAYQPHSAADQVHMHSHDGAVSARHIGGELNQSLPAAQPMRAASMRQADMRYQTVAGGDMVPDVSIRPTVPQTSASTTSHLGNSSPFTRTMDVIHPDVPPSSSPAHQDAVDQHRSQRDSFDLPAPPTPPSSGLAPSSLSVDRLPSPPMMIAGVDFPDLPSQPYLPPPELIASPALSDLKAVNQSTTWHKTDVMSAAVDNSSDSSSLVTTQQADDLMKNEPPLVRDTRCDLLAAIREGLCSLLVYVFSLYCFRCVFPVCHV